YLVNDDQSLFLWRLAPGDIMCYILGKEATNAASFFAECDAIEQDIGSIDIIESEAPVQLTLECLEKSAVAIVNAVGVMGVNPVYLSLFPAPTIGNEQLIQRQMLQKILAASGRPAWDVEGKVNHQTGNPFVIFFTEALNNHQAVKQRVGIPYPAVV